MTTKSTTIQCPHCEGLIKVSVHGKKSEPKKVSPHAVVAMQLIGYYKEQFQEIISTDPLKQPIITYKRVMNPFIKAIEHFGADRVAVLIDAYLGSDDPFYSKNGWSLELFLAGSTLNKLNIHTP